MNPKDLEKAFASTGAVLAGFDKSKLDDSTPCKSWKARELANHIVGGTMFFATVAETGKPPTAGEAPDFADRDDVVAVFNRGASQAVEAFEAEGAMEKMMQPGYAELPGSVFIDLAAMDTFTHGWDLAKCLGQSTDLDPALASQLLGVAPGLISDSMRGEEPKPFGPIVEPPAGASPADRLAAFLGRQA